MSTIQAITYDDGFIYVPGTTPNLTNPSPAFMTQTAGTLTVTTPTGTLLTMTVLAGVIYPIAWKAISLGTVTGGIIALRAQPYKGTTT